VFLHSEPGLIGKSSGTISEPDGSRAYFLQAFNWCCLFKKHNSKIHKP
jgi:hypothetical protein